MEKAEECLDKLKGVIELEEEGGDIVEIFEDEAGIEGKYMILFFNIWITERRQGLQILLFLW